ncbi:unnamed protein product [Ambrosiozyma monospora]|uniref:Unnamed protein product n=1 Tax=Ambrosiozyma monospora TaxID=43982 RepID=A0ACB5STF7_AMBMO|nr:unnamed protein product [Ambrosiozyma monospora]
MALKELDLTLNLNGLGNAPFLDNFIDFVTEKSVQLSSIESLPDINLQINDFYFKFVNSFRWPGNDITDLHRSGLLSKLTALTEFSAELRQVEDISLLERILEDLQITSPFLKKFHLICCFHEVPEESYAQFLVRANNFIIRHKELDVQFDISFKDVEIGTHWILNSKTQFALPLDIAYPGDTKRIENIKQ